VPWDAPLVAQRPALQWLTIAGEASLRYDYFEIALLIQSPAFTQKPVLVFGLLLKPRQRAETQSNASVN